MRGSQLKRFLTVLGFGVLLVAAAVAPAQTTLFTYQGKLDDGAGPANGNYDFRFRLYDAASGGAQLGAQLVLPNVPVTNGIFRAPLNFGPQFTGGERFLEIDVKTVAAASFTVLAPRQAIRSAPYAIRSLESATADSAENAQSLGGVTANQYVQTGDSRLADARQPLAGSSSYIQNSTIVQPSTNFNIGGNGSLGGTLTASGAVWGSEFRINGAGRVLDVAGTSLYVGAGAGIANTGVDNTFVGIQAGELNVTGTSNSFFGTMAGRNNRAGANSFFGSRAGEENTEGVFNTLVGYRAGRFNQTGAANAFFGDDAGLFTTSSRNSFFGSGVGLYNTTGTDNSYFGQRAGQGPTGGSSTGSFNSFFGRAAGFAISSGLGNSFFGFSAGSINTTGSKNTAIGSDADVSVGGLTNATAIGADAPVSQSNSLVLGSITGQNGATASTNVGIGVTAPKAKLHVAGGNIFIAQPNSLIITSPNGACWFITVNNSGVLSTITTPCP